MWNYKILKFYLMVFTFYFFCCLGLGYATLNRFDPLETGALNDFIYYENIVRMGFYADGWIKLDSGNFHQDDLTRNRILVPYLAHIVFNQLPELGSWNLVNFSMLVITSLFTASTALLICKLSMELFASLHTAIIASLLFLLSFFVTNSYLVGSVDSGYGFFLALLTYALYREKLIFWPILAILGTLTKEIFLVVGAGLILGWLLYDFIHNKVVRISQVISFFLFLIISLIVISTLYYIHTSEFMGPWTLIEPYASSEEAEIKSFSIDFHSSAISFAKFLFVIGPLVVLASFSLLKVPRLFLASNICAWVASFGLSVKIGLSLEEYARYMFSSGAFLLCLCAAITLTSAFDVTTKRINSEEK